MPKWYSLYIVCMSILFRPNSIKVKKSLFVVSNILSNRDFLFIPTEKMKKKNNVFIAPIFRWLIILKNHYQGAGSD